MTAPTNEIIYSLDSPTDTPSGTQCLVNNTEFVASIEPRLKYRRLMYERWYQTRRAIAFNNRVRACHTMLLPHKNALDVQINADNRARIVGHAICDNVWLCPLCSNKRAHVLASKLNALLTHCLDNNLTVYFITLTMSHAHSDSLTALYDDLKLAYRKMRQSRAFKVFLDEDYFDATMVVFTEITFGMSNGFHPHLHILAFASDGYYAGGIDTTGMNKPDRERAIAIDNMEREDHIDYLHRKLTRHWLKALRAVKRAGSEDVAVNVRMSDKAIERIVQYLNDDGIDEVRSEVTGERAVNRGLVSEVTSTNKIGRAGNIHPYDLPVKYPDKFTEYAQGTKGKQKVSGLDDALARYGVTIDTDIAPSTYVTLFSMSIEDYRLLIKSETVASFLEFIEQKHEGGALPPIDTAY